MPNYGESTHFEKLWVYCNKKGEIAFTLFAPNLP